ncbi:alpha N-terminal protein methyltransferase [Trichophyton mentagrophytes]|uniref:Alpha N-terminal protein methyltransferase 1 n=1 Tax=Trichophyton interdigitale (strain MR816) TaxID=1215338 RepID=A0A059JF34_TRIIM|nr:hypothetical protein H101_05131 [Trichophyton interdigitale H6]KDB26082.1 hypothetical protein H109_02089 [Trichophyton interdigitale MR816]GBF60448.1 alpha N-terminal protein methyltransferase [Trichophyton mentagrophytes]
MDRSDRKTADGDGGDGGGGEGQLPPDRLVDNAGAVAYWKTVEPNINGMLGGFPEISRADLLSSRSFLANIRRLLPSIGGGTALAATAHLPPLQLGVDCGAGIGRVTEGLLSKVCEVVDIVEPVEAFAKVLIEGRLKAEGKVGDVYITGLENWVPGKRYDLIWIQWCLLYLTDDQVVQLLTRCRDALSPSGVVIVKENLNTKPHDTFDPQDKSVTRAEEKYKHLFKRSGYSIMKEEDQLGFPQHLNLLPVKLFALCCEPNTPST